MELLAVDAELNWIEFKDHILSVALNEANLMASDERCSIKEPMLPDVELGMLWK